MTFEVVANLAISLVIAGITIIFVVLYIKRRSNFTNKLLLELYKINKKVEQDVLLFIDETWQVLEMAGFNSVSGKVNWYGEAKDINHGKTSKTLAINDYLININEGDVRVNLSFTLPKKIKGENKLIADLIYQTFVLLLSANVNSKNIQFILSKERLERFQVFVYHDIKNLAQFISLLANQVKAVKITADKVLLVDKLKKILPSLVEKSNKITSQMQIKSKDFDDFAKFSITEQIIYYAQINEIFVKIDDATNHVVIFTSKLVLQQVLSELMKNFKDHSNASNLVVKVTITEQTQTILITFAVIKQKSIIQPERMFEPFWTTSKSGMGLGLFMIRDLLKKVGGKIEFKQSKDVIEFCVYLPNTNTE